jgi:hypothetical protein
MRGIVYRLGRRRTGGVLAAIGVTCAIAAGSAGATVKVPRGSHPPVKAPIAVTQRAPVAHGAGHKIG